MYRQKKDLTKSLNLFEEGLRKFGAHRGLMKNYFLLLKANPSLPADTALSSALLLKQKKKTSFREM